MFAVFLQMHVFYFQHSGNGILIPMQVSSIRTSNLPAGVEAPMRNYSALKQLWTGPLGKLLGANSSCTEELLLHNPWSDVHVLPYLRPRKHTTAVCRSCNKSKKWFTRVRNCY